MLVLHLRNYTNNGFECVIPVLQCYKSTSNLWEESISTHVGDDVRVLQECGLLRGGCRMIEQ